MHSFNTKSPLPSPGKMTVLEVPEHVPARRRMSNGFDGEKVIVVKSAVANAAATANAPAASPNKPKGSPFITDSLDEDDFKAESSKNLFKNQHVQVKTDLDNLQSNFRAVRKPVTRRGSLGGSSTTLPKPLSDTPAHRPHAPIRPRCNSSDEADNGLAPNRTFIKDRRIELKELEDMDRRLKMRNQGRTMSVPSIRHMLMAEEDNRLPERMNRVKEMEQELQERLEQEEGEKQMRRRRSIGAPKRRTSIGAASQVDDIDPPKRRTSIGGLERPTRRTSVGNTADRAPLPSSPPNRTQSITPTLPTRKPSKAPQSRNEDSLTSLDPSSHKRSTAVPLTPAPVPTPPTPRRIRSVAPAPPPTSKPSKGLKEDVPSCYTISLKGDESLASLKQNGAGVMLELPSSREGSPLTNEDHLTPADPAPRCRRTMARAVDIKRPKRRSYNDHGGSDVDSKDEEEAPHVEPARRRRSVTPSPKSSKGRSVAGNVEPVALEYTSSINGGGEKYVSTLKGSEDYVVAQARADGQGGILLELPPSRDVSPLSNEDHMFNDSVPSFEPRPADPPRRRRSMSGDHVSDRPKRRSSNDGCGSNDDATPVVSDPPRRRRSVTPGNKGSSKMEEEEKKGKKTKKKLEEKVDKERRHHLKSSRSNSVPSMRDLESMCASEATRKTESSDKGEQISKIKSAAEDTEEQEHLRMYKMTGRSNSDPSLRDLAALIREQAALIEKQAALLEERKLQVENTEASSGIARKKGKWRIFSKH